jgi:puromycin-sensitive aminopeptidase
VTPGPILVKRLWRARSPPSLPSPSLRDGEEESRERDRVFFAAATHYNRRMESSVRLPTHVRPLRYQIDFQVDPDPGTFGGEVRIELLFSLTTRTFELHSVGHDIFKATLKTEGRDMPVTIEAQPDRERLRLHLPESVAGPAVLTLRFQGKLQAGLRGLYKVVADGQAYAFTQFEPADARRAFPCFDEPELKAQFEISVSVPEGLSAISNGEVIREEVAGGRHRLHFAVTPHLSTYLVALAVGRFSKVERFQGATPVRVIATPGKERLSGLALDMGAAFLPILEEYFGLPYPYGKLDMLAVPDFEAGAMENAGAIFYRESALLLDPEQATLDAMRQVAMTVAHEMAHQWFGNLVTMVWWDDLWLNEAFATWTQYKVVDAWHPDWQVWTDFERMKTVPLHLDSLVATRPIQAEVRTPEQANEMFDGITYNKGAAVLRMFEVFMGPERFRAGVRDYLAAHQGGNATAADLWRALGKASGQPIGELAQSWFTQPGYPILRLTRQGSELAVTQRRFLAKPEDANRVPAVRWTVPFALKVGEEGVAPRQVTALLRGEKDAVSLGGDSSWFFGNAEGSGFYRVAYEEKDLHALAGHRTELSPVERVSLLGDQWAQVRSGAPLSPHLPLVQAWAQDRQRTVLETVMAQLVSLDEVVVADADRPALGSLVRKLLRGHVERLGFDPRLEESTDERLLRPRVFEVAGRVGDDTQVQIEARERLARYLANGSAIDSSMLGMALRLSVRGNGPEIPDLYEVLRRRMLEAKAPEEHDRFLSALCSFEAPSQVERTLSASLGPDIRAQDLQLLFAQIFANRAARGAAWEFLKASFDAVRAKAPVFGMRRILGATAYLVEARWRDEVERFFSDPAHHVEAGERELRQTLEAIDLQLAFRVRERANLATYLGKIGNLV